ncbi:hypothetical protein [Lentilactobacillus kisonensis]|uniref:Uncharacterized protein n=1 Tax=Lentilactobacillus kisonensis DSM 19906 = JCM 15041 TaxID=1423766 RepID=A0A0R1NIH1_9LACO|nr:hypothetical protein [Lentilactobacillus kisonensis]KRL20318.1 hypothetical protein FC98_GL001728 [Lentilactobacillus kisonensis DSM 19906 = JCM 15041]
MKKAAKFANIWFMINLVTDLFAIPFQKDAWHSFKDKWCKLDIRAKQIMIAILAVILPIIWLVGFIAALFVVNIRKTFVRKSD